jgi:hypothetical protein
MTLLWAWAIVLALGAMSAQAQAAPSLTWSSPTAFDSGKGPSAVSCPTESLCVAVDDRGDALRSLDPTASAPSWSADPITPGERPLSAVSCAPGGPCVAVDEHGEAFVNADPSSSSSWPGALIDEGNALTGVSCPSASLCVAVDAAGNVLTNGSPGSGGWARVKIDGNGFKGVSCSSTTQCVAVDDAGNVLWSSNPTRGESEWHARPVDFGELLAVSCASESLCVAVDASGAALASANPDASDATWSVTPIDAGERVSAVSCAPSGLCVAVDDRGDAQASDHATEALPDWSGPSGIDSTALTGISCLPGGLCMAVDAAGDFVSARVPAPAATTVAATEVTSTSALLAGEVNPNDAALGACTFEYGTTIAYTQRLPCSATPAANGGVQHVSAQLTGLAPNTAYHYRVVASSPAGTGVGADAVFTTAASPLVAIVTPNPSITGTPAVGQRLACHPGTPSGAAVSLSYAWLRDLIPIAGSTGSTYTVQGQDSGHHLQCQVTATDGGGSATAKSAFVTIPVGGAPASAGETTVGNATFKSGRVSVPITCSPRASGGCEVAVRLQAVETLSGKRIVAVAARAVHKAHSSAATLRHVTITLASVRVHLKAGAHATVAVALSATGRRLLASRRRFSAYLYVSGTVIGVLEAQLARQLLTLSASSHSASVHATRRSSHAARRSSHAARRGSHSSRRSSHAADRR